MEVCLNKINTVWCMLRINKWKTPKTITIKIQQKAKSPTKFQPFIKRLKWIFLNQRGLRKKGSQQQQVGFVKWRKKGRGRESKYLIGQRQRTDLKATNILPLVRSPPTHKIGERGRTRKRRPKARPKIQGDHFTVSQF